MFFFAFIGLTLVGCGNNAQSSDAHNAEYEEGYATGYEAGYNDGKQQIAESKKHFAQFSGSFMATVEQLLPDYYALPGSTTYHLASEIGRASCRERVC